MEQSTFTERTREFCLYTGVAGMLISVISIIHYFIAAAEFHWMLFLLCIPNVAVFISCFFMARTNRWVILMLGISLLLFLLYFIFVFFLMRNFIIIFSPSSFVLFVYIFALFLYSIITDLYSKLKENHLARKKEADYWNGKV